MATMSSNNTNKEKSLLEILYIVYRGKTIIILSTLLFLVLAVLYNLFSTPVFESKALLKKENPESGRDEFYELVSLQTQDRLETEIQLLQTEAALSRVIDELNLRVELKKIIDPFGNSFALNNVFINFPDSGNTYAEQIPFSLPIFKNVELKNKKPARELCIEKKGEKYFELRDVEENRLIISLNTSSVSALDTVEQFYVTSNLDSILAIEKNPEAWFFNADFAQFEFSWNDAPVGSKIYFNFNNYYELIRSFRKSIHISGVGGTNMFTVSIRSSTPLACKVIADHVIRSFIELRMEQQKQTSSYSVQLVDEQLTEVQAKLLNAESNLSKFKASGQIMTIDNHTSELMGYLSTLESVKLETDLLLSNYKDKAEAMRNEIQASGYFDQSFLEPSGEFEGNSPFSTLMTHLSDLEMQRLELLQKRTENHPDVINLNNQIRLTEEKLAVYNENTLTQYSIIIKTLEKKLLKIAILMSGYEVKMQQLPEQENRMAGLLREQDVYKKIFTLLLDKREEMRVAELSKLQDIVVIDQPQEPYKPIKPRKILNMLIGLCLGGCIGIVFIFLLELRRTRLINIDDLEEEFKIPILALIPKYDRDIVKRINNPADNKDRFVVLKSDNLGIRESYRLLRTKLHQLDIREKTLLITSCEENTGKTSIVANLAITMAKEGKKILIVDCDLRKAELSKIFDVPLDSPGLIDFITKGGSPAIYTRVLKKIDIIPAGGVREDSSSLLSSDRMKSLFKAIDTSVYHYIIIDTPPVTRVVDTLVLGQFVKNAILIVRPDTSMKEAVIGGIQELNNAKVKIRGVVANAAEIQKSYYYRYRYGYGYGYTSDDKKRSSDKKRVRIAETSVNLLG
jgi:capsular exopolysaccharide synthesis family protein